MTPVILVKNTLNWWRARDLPEADLPAANVPIGAPPPPIASGNFTHKLIAGVIAWATVGYVIVYHKEISTLMAWLDSWLP